MNIVPDASLWANRYRQIVFDELPKEPARDDLLFKTTPAPRITCFGLFSPAPDGEPGTYRLGANYFWDNRGGFTKQMECGEGEAMLLSFPTSSDAKGEARFVTVPSHMRLKKQKAYRLDINIETNALNVSHRDATPQEAEEEKQRMSAVLNDDHQAEKSEASLDFVDGEWHIRGDPRSASGHSKLDAKSGENGTLRDGAGSIASGLRALPMSASPRRQSPGTALSSPARSPAVSPRR